MNCDLTTTPRPDKIYVRRLRTGELYAAEKAEDLVGNGNESIPVTIYLKIEDITIRKKVTIEEIK
jgi:hypothetical protein